jgi:hypothetical protein
MIKRPHLTEGLVIVVSILLAFGIEAAWAEYSEAREAHPLLDSIRDDVEATRVEVALQRTQSEELAGRARHLLSSLANPPNEDVLREALRSLGSIFITSGWEPVTHTYDEAVNSGRLRLIDSDPLRLALTRYHAGVEEVNTIHRAAETQYYGQLEPFMVEHTVYSELAADWWRGALVEAPFKTDFEALATSRELWNLVTLRLEVEVAMQNRLERMDALSAEVTSLLNEELGPGAS